MRRILARTLLGFSTDQLWETLHGRFMLVFDNGVEIETNEKECLYSSYFWDMHRKYIKTPILPHHHVQAVLGGKSLTSGTHIALVNKVYWDVVTAYGLNTPAERDPITKMIFEITTNLYNDLTYRAEDCVVSLDILDFISVVTHPKVKDSLDKVDNTQSSITEAYSVLTDTLNNDPALRGNALGRAVRAKGCDINQVMQCVGPRGFVTEVDGAILPVPVTRGYTQGMRTLYNQAAESRPAAKSLYFAEAPLQDAEYFARRLQLLCMTVERLYHGDCGSTDYMLWRVKPPTYGAGGRMVYAGDLQFMEGKIYFDEESKSLKVLRSSDTHLIGQLLKLRAVQHCKHADKHGVCSTCFGDMSKNISPHANLGHICSATMTQQTSQSVLSAKHIEASSISEPISLTDVSSRFFTVGKAGNTYLLKPELLNMDCKMIIGRDEAMGLTDIMIARSVSDIIPSRISAVEYVTIATTDKTGISHTPVAVSQSGRPAILSLEFLKYLRAHHWTLDEKNNFVFDLKGWKFDEVVMQLPEVEYSYSDHSKQIASIIESRMQDVSDRSNPESPAVTLAELFDLVNAKLSVNMALLEVIVYAAMVADLQRGNMALARGSETASMGVVKQIIKNRSLGPALAFEDQAGVVFNPESFNSVGKPDSVFDVFLCPKEVVEAYYPNHPR